MAFVDEGTGGGVNGVGVWRALSQGHEEDGVAAADLEVHAFLQVRAFSVDELRVAYDVVDFHGGVAGEGSGRGLRQNGAGSCLSWREIR